MGLIVKRNKSGKYKLISSVSDEIIHENKWLTETEAKYVLIQRLTKKYMEDIIEVYMDFPIGYYSQHGLRYQNKDSEDNEMFLEFMVKNMKNYDNIVNKFEDINEELNLGLKLWNTNTEI